MTSMDKETKQFLRGLGIFGGITALICLLRKALAASPPEPKPELYGCPYCVASFSTQAELDEHIASMHAAPPPPLGRATVYGKITDAMTGKPLQGIMAQFNGHQTGTDKNGGYRIELPAGTYFTVRFYDCLMRYETKELLIPLNLADGQVMMLNVSLRSLIPD